jgi:cell division protein FtsB
MAATSCTAGMPARIPDLRIAALAERGHPPAHIGGAAASFGLLILCKILFSCSFSPPRVSGALTAWQHNWTMVIRPRIRAFLTALGLYVVAVLFIGYFGVNAYTGKNGINARQELEQQIADLASELGRVRAERMWWQHRVALLKNDRIDPDMLDERARELLNYLDPHELTVMVKHR